MRTADLFCGCGGLTEGAISSGLNVVIGIDNNPMVLETYSKNQTHDAINLDLSNVEEAVTVLKKYNLQAVVGSPPCIDFSSSGNMKEGEHASLTNDFIDIAINLNPDIIIMENVARIHVSKSFKYVEERLLTSGYSFATITLNAKYCGVAQSRHRLFLCATKYGPIGPRALHEFFIEHDRDRNKQITIVKDVIEGCEESIYFAPRNRYHPCVLSTNKPYPTLRSCRGKCMERPTANYQKRYEDVTDIHAARILSIEDASLISSFRKDYIWPDSRVDVGIMLGNCVPPLMAKFVISSTLELFKLKSSEPCEYISHNMRVRRIQPSYMKRFIALIGTPAEGLIVMDAYNGGYEMRYTCGSDKIGDTAMARVLGWSPQSGWTIIIRERMTKKSKIDDVYIQVPGYATLFRGLRGLRAMNIITT